MTTDDRILTNLWDVDRTGRVGMDELERYLARRRRRRLFVLTIRDPGDEQARWARLEFEVSGELVFGPGRLFEGGPLRLWLRVRGSGLADFEGRMALDGWTKTAPGCSDPRGPQTTTTDAIRHPTTGQRRSLRSPEAQLPPSWAPTGTSSRSSRSRDKEA